MESADVLVQPPTTSDPAAWFWLFFFSLVLGSIFAYLVFGVNISEISNHWPKYRCNPAIMPFASFFGYDTSDNFNYCVGNIFQGSMGEVTNPFASVLGFFAQGLSMVITIATSFRVALATLMGGITVVFQDIVERFKAIVGQMYVTFTMTKQLMGRAFAIFYAIIYMGASGMRAGQNFGNTFLFRFLDTFCFDPYTMIQIKDRGRIPISEVKLGDVLMNGARVTALYQVAADGQPMVVLPGLMQRIHVSANHLIRAPRTGQWILSKDYPTASETNAWNGGSNRPLICLDTDTHEIVMDGYTFSDYTETNETDHDTMRLADKVLGSEQPIPDWVELASGIEVHEEIQGEGKETIAVGDIKIGQKTPGGTVLGIVEREVPWLFEIDDTLVTPSTLLWDDQKLQWIRACHWPSRIVVPGPFRVRNFFVAGTSIIHAEHVKMRDLMEIHSPDMEGPTFAALLEGVRV